MKWFHKKDKDPKRDKKIPKSYVIKCPRCGEDMKVKTKQDGRDKGYCKHCGNQY